MEAKRIAQLRKYLKCYGHEELKECLDAIERLQAIVDKLPKTADDVSVVPGMHAFIIVDAVILMRLVKCSNDGFVIHSGFVDNCPSTLKQSVVVPVSHSYSTREAAEQAAEERKST